TTADERNKQRRKGEGSDLLHTERHTRTRAKPCNAGATLRRSHRRAPKNAKGRKCAEIERTRRRSIPQHAYDLTDCAQGCVGTNHSPLTIYPAETLLIGVRVTPAAPTKPHAPPAHNSSHCPSRSTAATPSVTAAPMFVLPSANCVAILNGVPVR